MMAQSLIIAAAAIVIAAILCGATLTAWRGWLELQRARIGESEASGIGVRIELAGVRERLKRLERIADGIEP